MKRIIIIGASSGIGQRCAEIFASKGYKVAIAARRVEKLIAIEQKYPSNIVYMPIDITQKNADQLFLQLIQKNGGMDIYLHVSGIGFHNGELAQDKEIATLEVNGLGFTRMITTAFNYFKEKHIKGHISCITSIAGTKGMGLAPSYSSTKRFQNTYITCLEQLSHINKLGITFTDIRPGFVNTDLLDPTRHYPLLMDANNVSKTIVKSIEAKKRIKVINNKYALITFFWRLIPNYIWVRLPLKN
ncbi:MAG: SDR family NAD(P)-dependent oxidoreductase [Bacteroidales bacterium]